MMILKIGGSALTVKDADIPTVDEDNLERICDEISGYSGELVVVHGAGSFGHIYAREYELGEKITDSADYNRKVEGLCRTQASMQLLNYTFVERLCSKGVPAVALKPSSFMMTEDARIKSCDMTVVKRYLEDGFVPVLYGDAVLDYNMDKRFAILSGDQIITYLAVALGADRVILSSDVDGIYTDNPKLNPDAELISVVTRNSELKVTSDDSQADVTGGMMGKINELLELADKGVESLIINAEKEGNIRLAVSNRQVKGTIIK